MALRIATRASNLALWQANHVADGLRRHSPGLTVELVKLTTSGDQRATEPISALGGKGVFVKEIQRALLDGRADVAVHSAKDLPSETPDQLIVAAVPERADPRDVLVGAPLGALVAGTTVATGSARRRVQLRAAAPEVAFAELRGSIETRLEKAAGFDAIVMASAALTRLGIHRDDVHVLPVDVMTPQVGQGALAVECRRDDPQTFALLQALDDARSNLRFSAERAFLRELGGDCDLPAGAYAVIDNDQSLTLFGVLASMDASRLVRTSVRATMGPDEHRNAVATAVGVALARNLRTALG